MSQDLTGSESVVFHDRVEEIQSTVFVGGEMSACCAGHVSVSGFVGAVAAVFC